MNSIRRAVIDVGTNSVKLLVADVAGREVRPIMERSEQTRLGEGFFETHELRTDAVERTARVVARFVAEARTADAAGVRVIATSAARDARNQLVLLESIRARAGVGVDVISGEQEADWAFAGVTTDPTLATRPLLILDVGGGSTEFILGEGEVRYFRESFRLGTVRLLEGLRPGDPPAAADWERCREQLRSFLRAEVTPRLRPALARSSAPVQLVGTGGTTTILSRIKLVTDDFDRAAIESAVLSRDEVGAQRRRLWGLPLSERRLIKGLPANRADVILMGVAIFDVLMEEYGFGLLRVSTRGLRYAALMDPP